MPTCSLSYKFISLLGSSLCWMANQSSYFIRNDTLFASLAKAMNLLACKLLRSVQWKNWIFAIWCSISSLLRINYWCWPWMRQQFQVNLSTTTTFTSDIRDDSWSYITLIFFFCISLLRSCACYAYILPLRKQENLWRSHFFLCLFMHFATHKTKKNSTSFFFLSCF